MLMSNLLINTQVQNPESDIYNGTPLLHKIVTLWNPNGLTQKKWDSLLARLPGSLTPSLCLFTESHQSRGLVIPRGWTKIQNPHMHSGVMIIHDATIITNNIWKSDDGRVITLQLSDENKTINLFLGYWPAKDAKLRSEFNSKYKDKAKAADVIFGDFNSVEDFKRDSDWTREHKSPGFSSIISGKIDPAVEHLENSDGMFTNRHLGKTSRIDRAYANKLCDLKYINNLDFGSDGNSHCPVIYSIGKETPNAPKEWRLAPSCFMSRETRKELRGALLEIDANTESMDYIKKVKETTMKLQKKIISKKKKWIYRAKHLLNHISRDDPERMELEGALREMERCNLEKKRLFANKKWTLHNECPNSMVTRMLKALSANAKVKKIRHPITKQVVEEPDEVMDAFHSFYKDLYSDKHQIDYNIMKISWRIGLRKLPKET